jgi:hypothetical protein
MLIIPNSAEHYTNFSISAEYQHTHANGAGYCPFKFPPFSNGASQAQVPNGRMATLNNKSIIPFFFLITHSHKWLHLILQFPQPIV